VAINSIPQQDVANGRGHNEFARASPMALSNLVAKNPAPSTPGGASDKVILLIRFYLRLNGIARNQLIPIECPLLNYVDEAEKENAHEDKHFNQSLPTKFAKIHRPGIHKNHLDIENHKQDGDQEIFNGKGLPRITNYFDSRFKSSEFIFGPYFRSNEMRANNSHHTKTDRYGQLNQDRNIIYRQTLPNLSF